MAGPSPPRWRRPDRAERRTRPTRPMRRARPRPPWGHHGPMPESRSVLVPGRTTPLGAYPHLRIAGDLLFVSGTSARQPDNVVEGTTVGPDGEITTDIRVQTRAVFGNISAVLAAVDLTLDDVVDITSFLLTM